MYALILLSQLHFGPTYSPVFELPVREPSGEISLLETRWNYRTHGWEPQLTPGQQAWMKKWGHILTDWRWDLGREGWVRRRSGPLMCLT